MKRAFPVLLAAFAASGCVTARGRIEVGQTPQQVEDALGRPDRLYKRQTAAGELEAWGYSPYWPGFGLPSEPIGSRGSLSTDIPLEPIRDDEDLRVFFKQGKVIAVESRRR